MVKTFSKKKSRSKYLNKPITRKELRKRKQEEKKEKKHLFFSRKNREENLIYENKQRNLHTSKCYELKRKKKTCAFNLSSDNQLSDDVREDNESLNSDFSDKEVNARLSSVNKNFSCESPTTKCVKQEKIIKANKCQIHRIDAEEQHRRELKRQQILNSEARKNRIKQLKLENLEENKLISRLEKRLKLNKTKNKSRLVRKMFSDGLDFALEFCLDEEQTTDNHFDDKRLNPKKRQLTKPSWSDEEQDEERFNEIFGRDSELDETSSECPSEKHKINNMQNKSNNHEITMQSNVVQHKDQSILSSIGEYKEDIYGRRRDQDGNIITDATGVYMPPHQRALLSIETDDKARELFDRLGKQCKGLLNRLSESNLCKIATDIENLYMKNSRYNMNETLTKLLKEALIVRVMSNERMVQEHMVLLAYLHARIGNEIGAHFLQVFVKQFDTLLKELQSNNDVQIEDKRLNNVIMVLSYMYVFRIFENRLMLDFIECLSAQLNEKTIECLLLIFQLIGFRLRKDDPSAFKNMMLDVQTKVAGAPLEIKENLRLKFMIDILNAVKNNNMNKIPKFDPQVHEHLRKKLKAMLKNDKYVVTLNIALKDLLRADKVGKWWIVGSAWSGNIKEMASAKQIINNDSKIEKHQQKFSEQLLQLAKQQKMNTAERRDIFCIIMSANDYVDAFEKLLHLSLKDYRSIAYVIIHCCLTEKHSNPYYTHLALKFCNLNRKYQLAFQFAAWDRINDIEGLQRFQIRNFAHFIQYLILQGGLQLAILKVINFLQLHKQSFLLMAEICKHLLLTKDDENLYGSFGRLAKNMKLQQFKQSILLFLQHFLLKEQAMSNLTDDECKLMKQRIEHIEKMLAYVYL